MLRIVIMPEYVFYGTMIDFTYYFVIKQIESWGIHAVI